ncbi:element excision factor XisH family protein [Moorena producens JHB]|uniref:Element excision factor XisH family protein n=1 Tax=Moorena producens (strain JHB) TaxID=1454205 RepID=A0A9Q9UW21_MOOP1|nr:element excision factor XisH family protein [Moorena producens]WAN69440.1 element excision factor XisH family protein [Moorena producens JHB]
MITIVFLGIGELDDDLCTLEKDGWTITNDPFILVLGQTLLKADLGAEKFFAAEK